MKLMFYVLASMLLTLSARAASIEGVMTLPYGLSDTNGTALTGQFGDAVKATWSCRVGEFYGWETVFARVTITNTGSQPMWGQCCMAFYDKDKKLVGTVAQPFIARRGLKSRASRTFNPCRLILPKDRYRDIVSYQAVIHETITPPLKKKESILLEDP
jgi:hypothetical protein